MKVRMNSARRRAIKMASAYSRTADLVLTLVCAGITVSFFTLVTFWRAVQHKHTIPLGLNFQGSKKRLLGNLHLADLFHALFTLFLLLQKLPFARYIAAVTLRCHVFAQRLDRFARNYATANCR